jgi:hypothetical protein
MKKGQARHELPGAQEIRHEAQEESAEQDATVPSWFVHTHHARGADNSASRQPEASNKSTSAAKEADEFQYEELGAAYESYRRRIEDRFRMAQQMVDQQVGHTAEARHHSPTQRKRVQATPPSPQFEEPPVVFQERSTGSTGRRKRVLGVSMPMAVVLTAFACAAGSAGGYFMANPNGLQSVATAGLALVDGFFDETRNAVAATNTSTRSTKVVKIAEVNVSDVAGPVNSPIPLEISALAPDTSSPINLKISGLPPNSYLTAGTEVKQGEWMLRPDEIQSAQLIVQRSDSPELGLLVTALDAETGVEAAPSKAMKVALDLNAVPTPGLQPPPNRQAQFGQEVTVTPVSAPPDQSFNKSAGLPQAVPPPKEVLQPESKSFLEKGDLLLKAGDIISARQFYLRAFELEDAAGAYGVGRTYDPKVYAELQVRGLSPDPEKAKDWYGKAAAAGSAEAAQELLTPPQ